MRALLVIAALFLFPASEALAQDLDLTGYLNDNGAITSYYYGDTIDPYFATKALLLAQDGELNARKASLAWVKWAMHAQRGDGLFNRYKKDPATGNWIVYQAADADDAMQALWIELLYRLSPRTGLPPEWAESARLAEARLADVLDKDTGIYHISESMPVGLLMDNVEIYSSFIRTARECKRMGLGKAKEFQAKADALRPSIEKIFGRENADYAITTQERTEVAFYPDRAAQVYPMLYHMTDGKTVREAYMKWRKQNGKEWLDQRNHDFPWGLVAIVALEMGDADSASCWQNRAEPMRYSGHWNILEEVALQHVKYRLKLQKYDKIPCVGGDLV